MDCFVIIYTNICQKKDLRKLGDKPIDLSLFFVYPRQYTVSHVYLNSENYIPKQLHAYHRKIGGGYIIDMFMGVIIGSSFVYDIYFQRIPNLIIITGYFILGLYAFLCNGGFSGIVQAVIGVTINTILWSVIYMLKGVKAGDVKFIAMISGYLTWSNGIKYSIIVLYVAAFMGIFKFMVEMASGNRTKNCTQIRFMCPILGAYIIMIASKGGIAR